MGTKFIYRDLPESKTALKRMCPAYYTLIEKAQERFLTAKDLQNILGVSYRQINDWDTKGLINFDRGSDAAWRRFSVFDILSLALLRAVNEQGIPLKKLKKFFGLDAYENSLYKKIPQFIDGKNISVWTDFETFAMFTDEEEIKIPSDLYQKERIVVGIALKPIIDKVVEKIKFEKFRVDVQKDGSYRIFINGVPLNLENMKDSVEDIEKLLKSRFKG